MSIKRDFIFDSFLVLYLTLYQRDGVSFTSQEAYGPLCTVTGASWRPQGRYFDGVDDIINCGDNTALRPPSAITVEAWAKNHDATNNVELINFRIEGSPYVLYQLKDDRVTITLSDNSVWASDYNTALPDEWKHVVMTWSRETKEVHSYIDSVLQNNYQTTSDLDLNVNNAGLDELYIGAAKVGLRYAKCTIGELRIYSRALTPLEIQHNYLTTKWRYQ